MDKRIAAALLSSGAAALTIGLSATSSFGATATWTVSPGGSIAGKAGATTLTDTTSKVPMSCTSSKLSGSLKSGKGLPGRGLGTFASVLFSNCTIAMSTGGDWKLNASSYNSATGVTSGTITGIHLMVQNSTCQAVVDGTRAIADDGKASITYSNATHVLKILPRGNLHVYNVHGCGGALSNGDTATITGSYKVSPPQKITSP